MTGVMFGAVTGAGAMVGLLLVIVGVRRPEHPVARTRTRLRRRRPVGRRSWIDRKGGLAGLAVVGACSVGGWLATGWPAMGANLAIGAAVVSAAREASAQRRHRDATSEAIASWAEMLADVMRSHAALGQAVQDTVDVVGPELAEPVRRLASRLGSEPLDVGLRRFGAEVDHPEADALVAALLITADGQGRDLPTVLDRIAERTRARTELGLRIAAGRARLYAEARTMSLLTLAVAALAVVVGRQFLRPYDSVPGQLVLLAAGGLFATAGLALVELGRPVDGPRPLRAGSDGGS